jgi:epoxyqueuosine reductase
MEGPKVYLARYCGDSVTEADSGRNSEPTSRLATGLKAQARELGFSLCGITTADATDHMAFYRGWIDEGRHGEMGYLAREDSLSRRADLKTTLKNVRSVVVVAHEYFVPDPEGVPGDPSRGVIARYARGDDYHDVVKKKLLTLARWVEAQSPGVQGRAYVDTGPILERDLARRAGIGWFGRNTMLINPSRGSYFFLGTLLLDIDLPADEPFEEDRCGTCSACLDACPTGALMGRDGSGAQVMDATRCISYLTIELRGAIPVELRPLMGNRVYGCDICQEVCPFTSKFSSPVSSSSEYAARPELDGPPLLELTSRILSMSGKGYARAFADSPLSRPRRNGMLRNLCVALGNWGDPSAVGTLGRALSDPSALVRSHAAWALREVGTEDALELLRLRAESESDPLVLGELGGAPSGAESSET